MHTKFDIITLEQPLFSMVTNRQVSQQTSSQMPDITICLNLKKIIFKESQLYILFKEFMDRSTTEGKSLSEYTAKFDYNSNSVEFNHVVGKENIIGKFFLETGLDWPEEYYSAENRFNPEFKQPTMNESIENLKIMYSKGVPEIYFAKQGKAGIPDSIIKLMNDFFEIKKVAPLIVQAYRTSPLSFFQNFKQDCFFSEIAHQLEPLLSKVDAAKKLRYEMGISAISQENMKRPFSFKEEDISYSSKNGTHVGIIPSSSFSEWLFKFKIGTPVTFPNGFVLLKKSANIFHFHTLQDTTGIEITNNNGSYFVCNNKKADKSEKSTIDEKWAERKARLKHSLTNLYSLDYSRAIQIAPGAKDDIEENNSHEKCVMM